MAVVLLVGGLAAPVARGEDATITFPLTPNAGPYVPSEVFIDPGDTVTWEGSFTSHPLVSDDGLWPTYSGPEPSFQHTFADEGRFRFHCQVHPFEMVGFVTVGDAPPPSPPPPPGPPPPPPPPPPFEVVATFYFAEGTVRPGFAEFVTLQNPGTPAGTARLLFQAADDSGAPVNIPPLDVALPGESRRTVNVNEYVAGQGVSDPVDVSIQVVSDRPILAEWPLYFNTALAGGVDGGTTVIGASAPAMLWTFAEGTVRPGFQEFLTLQNPLSQTAGAVISLQLADDSGATVPPPPPINLSLPPQSRVTRDINAYLAEHGIVVPVDVSARVDATAPIVVERPLYFRTDFSGVAPHIVGTVNGGTTVLGATAPATTFYFAEGTVRPGFHQFITLQNAAPDGPAAAVTLTFQTSGPPVPPVDIEVPAASRRTVNVAEVAFPGAPLDVSVRVDSDLPILAERPLYFSTGLAGGVDDGTAVVGATAPATASGFAEGTVRPGFEQFFTFQNPDPAGPAAQVTVTFQASDDAGQSVAVPPMTLAVAPGSRETRSVNEHVAGAGIGQPLDISARVVSDVPIVVERPMYFRTGLAGGVDGGTAVIGFWEGGEAAPLAGGWGAAEPPIQVWEGEVSETGPYG